MSLPYPHIKMLGTDTTLDAGLQAYTSSLDVYDYRYLGDDTPVIVTLQYVNPTASAINPGVWFGGTHDVRPNGFTDSTGTYNTSAPTVANPSSSTGYSINFPSVLGPGASLIYTFGWTPPAVTLLSSSTLIDLIYGIYVGFLIDEAVSSRVSIDWEVYLPGEGYFTMDKVFRYDASEHGGPLRGRVHLTNEDGSIGVLSGTDDAYPNPSIAWYKDAARTDPVVFGTDTLAGGATETYWWELVDDDLAPTIEVFGFTLGLRYGGFPFETYHYPSWRHVYLLDTYELTDPFDITIATQWYLNGAPASSALTPNIDLDRGNLELHITVSNNGTGTSSLNATYQFPSLPVVAEHVTYLGQLDGPNGAVVARSTLWDYFYNSGRFSGSITPGVTKYFKLYYVHQSEAYESERYAPAETNWLTRWTTSGQPHYSGDIGANSVISVVPYVMRTSPSMPFGLFTWAQVQWRSGQVTTVDTPFILQRPILEPVTVVDEPYTFFSDGYGDTTLVSHPFTNTGGASGRIARLERPPFGSPFQSSTSRNAVYADFTTVNGVIPPGGGTFTANWTPDNSTGYVWLNGDTRGFQFNYFVGYSYADLPELGIFAYTEGYSSMTTWILEPITFFVDYWTQESDYGEMYPEYLTSRRIYVSLQVLRYFGSIVRAVWDFGNGFQVEVPPGFYTSDFGVFPGTSNDWTVGKGVAEIYADFDYPDGPSSFTLTLAVEDELGRIGIWTRDVEFPRTQNWSIGSIKRFG